jgi:RNA polymerase sigma-70 factor, ECF subfamily
VPEITATSLLPLELNKLPVVATASAPQPASSPVATLTRRLAAGEEDAFREFEQLYFSRLYRFLLAVCHGEEDAAREAYQETLLRVLRHARAFQDEETFWCWLKAVARSAARDRHRQRHRYFALLDRFRTRIDTTDAREEETMGQLLAETLGELETAERALLEDKYVDGRSMKDLAEASGSTEKAVESRLLRLRRHLRQRILEKLKTP